MIPMAVVWQFGEKDKGLIAYLPPAAEPVFESFHLPLKGDTRGPFENGTGPLSPLSVPCKSPRDRDEQKNYWDVDSTPVETIELLFSNVLSAYGPDLADYRHFHKWVPI